MTTGLEAMTASEVIAALGLEPLPGEGGFIKLGPRTEAMNAIYFLMTDSVEGFSAMHRLDVSEGWQWLAGAPARMLQIAPDGAVSQVELSSQEPQTVVPAGVWQGCRTLGEWTLVSCWCAPAFRDEGFELGDRRQLVSDHPGAAVEIERLTR